MDNTTTRSGAMERDIKIKGRKVIVDGAEWGEIVGRRSWSSEGPHGTYGLTRNDGLAVIPWVPHKDIGYVYFTDICRDIRNGAIKLESVAAEVAPLTFKKITEAEEWYSDKLAPVTGTAGIYGAFVGGVLVARIVGNRAFNSRGEWRIVRESDRAGIGYRSTLKAAKQWCVDNVERLS
jgi:hypothetical protein